eukprot:Awhi_evm1s15554
MKSESAKDFQSKPLFSRILGVIPPPSSRATWPVIENDWFPTVDTIFIYAENESTVTITISSSVTCVLS